MSDSYVRVIPLGGLRTFGMNCCLIEHDGTLLMFDCGIAFPDANDFGLDYYLPDWSYVLKNIDRLAAIVITHAHEDHIGGVPFFLSQVDVPVYTGRYSATSLRRRLKEYNVNLKSEIHEVDPGDVVEIGAVELEFIHVNHSTANVMSVAVGTLLGDVIFTGDWKVDHTPIGEPVIDLPLFARMGDDGVLAVVGDSTNAEVPGFSRSEREVQRALYNVVRDAPGRVLIGLFSSNIPRVRGLVDTARRLDRRICLMGRSLAQNVQEARETGFLEIDGDDPFIEPHQLRDFRPEDVIILATGTQAEPRSTLARLANDDHHLLSLEDDDTIVFSARRIPGNESAIYSMIDLLVRRGATVITPTDAPVHASGHAQREEMKLLLNLLRPQWVVPVHGEYRMRRAHGKLAEELGFQSKLIEDGDVLELNEAGGAMVVDRIQIGRIAVDGTVLGDVDDGQIRDRRLLASTGMIVAFAVLSRPGELASLKLVQHGFLPADAEDSLDAAADYAASEVGKLKEQANDTAVVAETLRTAVRRYFRREIDRKPVVIPIVHEADPT